jgi:hypothetical protein
MTSQIAASNILSLRFHTEELDINSKFQLNRETRLYLGFIVITTFETKRSVTLLCNGLTKSRLNLLEALRSGLLELIESVNENIIMPPTAPSPPLGRRNIPPRPSQQHRQISVGVSADTTNDVWKRMLQPRQTYGLRLSKNNGKVVAYYTDEFSDQPENAQKLRIGREGGTYYFTVHDDPAPPRLFARLSMPQQAHLTGSIPFTFAIEYTTDSPSPLVLDKSRSPLSVFSEDLKSLDSLIDCRDKSTSEKVSWSAVFGCWDSDPHPAFPDNDDFVEISVDKSWRFECTLENLENEYEYVRSMEGLDAGNTYTARIAGRALGPFSRWQYGQKGDLLEGTLEERIRRWGLGSDNLGSLEVEMVGEDVEFETVA